ncbi:pyridoxamine 5'-phosphate oxidase family protein [Streptomyces sp. SID8352]|uniref:pyridoxamine 5'-phosphate oxidase family protein n=1 Tax=Streptomyces sp. SID8352 TaxID=2690338 RepID=UPI00136F77C3|nr:pyridoxamine 5'-phosphate oxidase family protein [Streptomyces sp. SID8352]MYU21979.1 pyridoxamine 5'-phosphate oxidase family protein [Streptomyces sp. SID8352]
MTARRQVSRPTMSRAEVDAFLGEQRVCRVATVSREGVPHVTPMWFVWDGSALWLYSLTRSRRWADLEHDPRIAAVVDAGGAFDELRGVELSGRAEFVGEVPRTGRPHGALREVERAYARQYLDLPELPHDGLHGWVRIGPRAIRTWDFRKLAEPHWPFSAASRPGTDGTRRPG